MRKTQRIQSIFEQKNVQISEMLINLKKHESKVTEHNVIREQ